MQSRSRKGATGQAHAAEKGAWAGRGGREEGGGSPALFCVHYVEGGHCLHAQLLRVSLGGLLGVIGPVEVLPRDAALAPSHVAADDEVCAACRQRSTSDE